ncbi:MAG: ribokinase [Halobacteriota archaeon]
MGTDSTARVAVVGSYNHGLTMSVPTLPVPGETVLGEGFAEGVGGKGSNQAVAASRLGAETSFVGCVGEDRFGDAAIELWDREGVDVRQVERTTETHTGVGFVIVEESGENAISVAPGANRKLTPEMVRGATDAIRTADVCLCQFEIEDEPIAEAVRIASAGGTDVVVNPAPARTVPDSLLSDVDVLTPNRSEARILAGYRPDEEVDDEDLLDELRDLGPRAIVLTRGSDGALVGTEETTTHVSAVAVDVVDTTGAGDAFNAGFAVGLGEGMSIVDAARFAAVSGSLACTAYEVVPALPNRKDVDQNR